MPQIKTDMILKGKKAAYITLGCKLNFSETSTIKHSLEEAGVITVGEKEGADIFVINTCSVTDMAEHKGRQLIRKIIHRYPHAYIVVVGCYAQLRAKEILEITGVNLVLGAAEKFKVRQHLEAYNTPVRKRNPLLRYFSTVWIRFSLFFWRPYPLFFENTRWM